MTARASDEHLRRLVYHGGKSLGHLVGRNVIDLDLGVLAGEFSHIPGGPGQVLTILTGNAAHNLPANHEIDRGFGRGWMSRAIGG